MKFFIWLSIIEETATCIFSTFLLSECTRICLVVSYLEYILSLTDFDETRELGQVPWDEGTGSQVCGPGVVGEA